MPCLTVMSRVYERPTTYLYKFSTLKFSCWRNFRCWQQSTQLESVGPDPEPIRDGSAHCTLPHRLYQATEKDPLRQHPTKRVLCALCMSLRVSHTLFLLENRRIQEAQVCKEVPSSQFLSECGLLIACDGGAPALRQSTAGCFMPFRRQRKFPDFHYRSQQDIGDILQAQPDDS